MRRRGPSVPLCTAHETPKAKCCHRHTHSKAQAYRGCPRVLPEAKCASCGKTAYPLESVTALEKQYHKSCFKCDVCHTTLNLKNFKGFEGKIYCYTHTPKVKGGPIGTDSISVKSATSVPKKDVALGVHKADSKVAPQRSHDFSVNQAGDQSTENAPDHSNISYDAHSGDQSTENAPDASSIHYESYSGDQSTENAPEGSNVYYEQHNADQSTEGYGNTDEHCCDEDRSKEEKDRWEVLKRHQLLSKDRVREQSIVPAKLNLTLKARHTLDLSTKMGKQDQKKTSTAPAAAAAAPAAQTTKATPTPKRNPPPVHSTSLWDRFAIAFLAFAFFVHAGFDGTWFNHHATVPAATTIPHTPNAFLEIFRKAWAHENAFAALGDTVVTLIKSLLNAYSLSDKRIATSNNFLQGLFGFNLYFLSPLILILAYGISHRRWWRHNLQLTVTSLQLFGIALYFLTEHFNHYGNVNTKSFKLYNVYFWVGNLAYAFPIALLFLQSFFSNPHSSSAKGPSHRVTFTVKFILASVFLGFIFLFAATTAHHFLDSPEVEKALIEAWNTSAEHLNYAYDTASASIAEGAHQAHVAASPYIEQAADFVQHNIHNLGDLIGDNLKAKTA
ncbi:LIM-type zinc finger-containing protein [Planoprotostelium fungivorum]|uniref:LIM-type zinc finger-containing protein n=1 Tax=Planoprotostelium fungivorum TaxID=1890364 RepID=A0A2P6NYF4_9EUKA|nr:LIM-type zinc finger-containing protein [Planoprotostelium fungivorum]